MSPIEVVIDESRPGWAIIRAPLSEFRKNVELERLPDLLDKSVTMWLAARPLAKVRAVLPIVEHGFTTTLHIWWD